MGRKQKKIHYIYKTTCDVNGKYYIGMHSTNKMDDGYLGSGKRLWSSIKYHGKENFTKEILEYCENRDELRIKEEEIVDEVLLTDNLCMNLKKGGQGGLVDENHRDKLVEGARLYQKKKWEDKEYRKKMSTHSSNIMKRTHLDGKLKYDNFKGKKHTKETKMKIGLANSTHQKGEGNSQYGKCWVYSDKEKISKRINKIELHEFLSNNGDWKKGRKLKW